MASLGSLSAVNSDGMSAQYLKRLNQRLTRAVDAVEERAVDNQLAAQQVKVDSYPSRPSGVQARMAARGRVVDIVT